MSLSETEIGLMVAGILVAIIIFLVAFVISYLYGKRRYVISQRLDAFSFKIKDEAQAQKIAELVITEDMGNNIKMELSFEKRSSREYDNDNAADRVSIRITILVDENVVDTCTLGLDVLYRDHSDGTPSISLTSLNNMDKMLNKLPGVELVNELASLASTARSLGQVISFYNISDSKDVRVKKKNLENGFVKDLDKIFIKDLYAMIEQCISVLSKLEQVAGQEGHICAKTVERFNRLDSCKYEIPYYPMGFQWGGRVGLHLKNSAPLDDILDDKSELQILRDGLESIIRYIDQQEINNEHYKKDKLSSDMKLLKLLSNSGCLKKMSMCGSLVNTEVSEILNHKIISAVQSGSSKLFAETAKVVVPDKNNAEECYKMEFDAYGFNEEVKASDAHRVYCGPCYCSIYGGQKDYRIMESMCNTDELVESSDSFGYYEWSKATLSTSAAMQTSSTRWYNIRPALQQVCEKCLPYLPLVGQERSTKRQDAPKTDITDTDQIANDCYQGLEV